MVAVKGEDLWSDSVSERLRSADALSEPKLEAVHAALCEGCPVEPWPYGNATSINPLLVTLGPSPGNSPDRAVALTCPRRAGGIATRNTRIAEAFGTGSATLRVRSWKSEAPPRRTLTPCWAT